MKRFSAALLFVLFALVPVLRVGAQAPAEFLHAEYGAGNRWTDVTQRVHTLFRGNELNFHVDNNTLGTDPAPGTVKTLRVSVREADGKTRQMEFKENQSVNLRGYNSAAAPSAGLRGAPSGGLHIVGAQYGADNRTIDVTDRLNSRIQNGQLNLQVMNQTMGGDPAAGKVKKLTVRYTLNGRSDQVVVDENGYLNLPADARATVAGGRDDRGNGNNQAYGNRDDRGSGNDQGYGNRDGRGSGNDQAYGNRDNRGGNDQGYGNPDNRGGGNDQAYGNRDNRGGGNDQGYGNRDNRSGGNDQGYGNRDNRGYDQARMERVVLPAGTELALRTNQRIDSRDVVEGQNFPAQIDQDVRDTDGNIAVPRGSNATLVTRRLEGNGDITLDVDSVTVDGRRYRVSTEDQELQNRRDGIGANRRTGEYVGGGAALGAIIGAIAGGGRGAAIGGAVGASAGAGTQIVTRGKEVHVPAETVIRFRLDRPLRLHLWQ